MKLIDSNNVLIVMLILINTRNSKVKEEPSYEIWKFGCC